MPKSDNIKELQIFYMEEWNKMPYKPVTGTDSGRVILFSL